MEKNHKYVFNTDRREFIGKFEDMYQKNEQMVLILGIKKILCS